eukprot:NODE_268_length_11281_cov_0.363799.p2 type:complete len:688 gc:universal NODE_268_length_11281_cov_0.363799:6870-8933(+)
MDEKESTFAFSIPLKIRETIAKPNYSQELKERKTLYTAMHQKLCDLEKSAKIMFDSKMILPPIGEEKTVNTLPEEWQILIVRMDRVCRQVEHLQNFNKVPNLNYDEMKSKLLSAYKEANYLHDELQEFKAKSEHAMFLKEGEIENSANKIKAILEENRVIQNDLQNLNNIHNKLKEEQQSMLEEKQSEATAFHQMEILLKQQIESLLRKNQEFECLISSKSFVNKTEHDNALHILNSKIYSLESIGDEMQNNFNELKQKDELLKEAHELLLLSHNQLSKNTEKVNADLQCSQQNLTYENVLLKNEVAIKNQQVSHLQMKLSNTEKELTDLKLLSTSEYEKLSAQCQASKRQLENDKNQYTSMTNEVRLLRRQMAELRANSEEAAKRDTRKLEELLLKISTLQGEMLFMETSHNSTIGDMSVDLNQKSVEINSLAMQLELANNELSRQKHLLRDSVLSLCDEKAAHNLSKSEHSNVLAFLDNASLLHKRDKEEIKNLRAEVENLSSELKSCDRKLVTITMQIESLKSNIVRQHKEALANQTSASAKLENSKNLLRELELKHNTLASQHESSLQTIEELKQDIKSRLDIITMFENQVALKNNEISKLSTDLATTRQQLDVSNTNVYLSALTLTDMQRFNNKYDEHYVKNITKYQKDLSERTVLLEDTLRMTDMIRNILDDNGVLESDTK